MFDHVGIRTSERDASERFYRTVLEPLEIEPTYAGDEMVEWDDFSIMAADSERQPTRNLHVGFVAPSREHVDHFWDAGVAAGYHDDGPPGERPGYRPDYYGAFLRDPDGNSVEAVHHGDTRRGGHIDHLWIGVLDLAAAEAFYTTLARHTGLRPGRRFEHGVQFRGARACTSRFQRRIGEPSTSSTPQRWRRATRASVLRASAPSTTPATTARTCWLPTGPTSRACSTTAARAPAPPARSDVGAGAGQLQSRRGL
jgi:catechol 2,3-dioxygenase-like lactoylglutathione lyase family enzyme